jgi:hypothetical protein
VSFDPCHDCGTNWWAVAIVAVIWASPLVLVFARRHRGDAWAGDPKLVRAILFLLAIALWVSWSYAG